MTILIRLTDNGTGVQIKKSNDPYFTTKTNGTGLGLIVNKIINEHSGDLQFKIKELERCKC